MRLPSFPAFRGRFTDAIRPPAVLVDAVEECARAEVHKAAPLTATEQAERWPMLFPARRVVRLASRWFVVELVALTHTEPTTAVPPVPEHAQIARTARAEVRNSVPERVEVAGETVWAWFACALLGNVYGGDDGAPSAAPNAAPAVPVSPLPLPGEFVVRATGVRPLRPAEFPRHVMRADLDERVWSVEDDTTSARARLAQHESAHLAILAPQLIDDLARFSLARMLTYPPTDAEQATPWTL